MVSNNVAPFDLAAELEAEMEVGEEEELLDDSSLSDHVIAEESAPVGAGDATDVAVLVQAACAEAEDPPPSASFTRTTANRRGLDDRLGNEGVWGSGRITFVKVTSSRKFGGWQGACKFHALNNKTGCKKFFGIKAPGGLEERVRALNQARWWLNEARLFDRQRHHLAWSGGGDISNMPASDVLFAQQPGRPEGVVKTDVQLDAEGAKANVATSSAPRSIGRKQRQPTKRAKVAAAVVPPPQPASAVMGPPVSPALSPSSSSSSSQSAASSASSTVSSSSSSSS